MLHNLVKLFQNEGESCISYVEIYDSFSISGVFLFIGLYVTRFGWRVKLYKALNTDVLKL